MIDDVPRIFEAIFQCTLEVRILLLLWSVISMYYADFAAQLLLLFSFWGGAPGGGEGGGVGQAMGLACAICNEH